MISSKIWNDGCPPALGDLSESHPPAGRAHGDIFGAVVPSLARLPGLVPVSGLDSCALFSLRRAGLHLLDSPYKALECYCPL